MAVRMLELAPLAQPGPTVGLADESWLDSYRQLSVSLRLPTDRGCVIGITSAIAGEGRTSTALGLASTLAADLDSWSLLIEADFDNPCLADRLGPRRSPGLAAVLRRQVLLTDVVQKVAGRLFVVTAGNAGEDGARLLRNLAETDPTRYLRGRVGVIILDLPPVLNNGYTPLATAICDAVVMVVRSGVTPARLVREAMERLDGSPVRGVVLNGLQCQDRSVLPFHLSRHGERLRPAGYA